jgi:threonyl-tRNA synthetase
MREILPKWNNVIGKEISGEEAKELFSNNAYKLELIDEILKDKQPVSVYTSGADSKNSFTDLCRGGHIENPSKEIKADSFKLTRLAGAYWRGSEKNAMLTRIYGLAFASKAELDNYENMMKEAEKRDHKKLGKELKLFTISALVGSGLPLIQPKGMIIRKAVEDYLWELHKHKGYQRVWTPHIAREELYVASGHASKFGNELFRVQGKEEKFFLNLSLITS